MPLGYYDAQIVVTSGATDHGTDVHVQIDAGVPTLVRELALGIDGAAQSDRQVQRVVSGFKPAPGKRFVDARRSEEHTSELQSLMRISYAVFCLKKKNK